MRRAPLRRALSVGLCLAVGALAACDDDSTEAAADAAAPMDAAAPALSVVDGPSAAPAAQPLALALQGVPGEAYTLLVTRGGGAVAQAQVVADAEGRVTAEWTLGRAPVDNALQVTSVADPSLSVTHTLRATLDTPWPTEAFADVNGWLEGEGIDTSTEDLSFRDGALLMGVAEGVISVGVDGQVARLPLTGEPITRIWGFAVDAEGALWGVDAGNSRLVRIGPDGDVSEALTTDGTQPLAGPNYVMVGADGRVYLSDPCLGEIIRLDPATGDVAVHTFDLQTEGGPNGMALGPDGAIYTVTENTGLLCQHPEITFDAEIAGLYRIDPADFGTHTAIAEGIGLFGDGLAFDAEGNLYVVVDKQANFRLTESAVKVVPAGTQEVLPFIVADEKRLIANVAFGQGAFGETTLYMAMLHVAPFTEPASRGLTRAAVGIAGQPLLPSAE